MKTITEMNREEILEVFGLPSDFTDFDGTSFSTNIKNGKEEINLFKYNDDKEDTIFCSPKSLSGTLENFRHISNILSDNPTKSL